MPRTSFRAAPACAFSGFGRGDAAGIADPARRVSAGATCGTVIAAGCKAAEQFVVFRRGGGRAPSDMSGIIYTPFGADEGWKVRLAKELRAAGLDVDLNQALG